MNCTGIPNKTFSSQGLTNCGSADERASTYCPDCKRHTQHRYAPEVAMKRVALLLLGVAGVQAQTACTTDANGDGEVGGMDLAQLLARWGRADDHADFDENGIVDGADLTVLRAAWGTPCGP